jgi:hypothetical protein
MRERLCPSTSTPIWMLNYWHTSNDLGFLEWVQSLKWPLDDRNWWACEPSLDLLCARKVSPSQAWCAFAKSFFVDSFFCLLLEIFWPGAACLDGLSVNRLPLAEVLLALSVFGLSQPILCMSVLVWCLSPYCFAPLENIKLLLCINKKTPYNLYSPFLKYFLP